MKINYKNRKKKRDVSGPLLSIPKGSGSRGSPCDLGGGLFMFGLGIVGEETMVRARGVMGLGLWSGGGHIG